MLAKARELEAKAVTQTPRITNDTIITDRSGHTVRLGDVIKQYAWEKWNRDLNDDDAEAFYSDEFLYPEDDY